MKKILSYIIWIGMLIVPFIPFIVADNMYFPFITGKGFAFRILVEVIFGLYLILALAYKEYRPKMSWLFKSVILVAFIVFLADLFGENVSKSLWSNYERMEGFVLIAHLVLYYVVASGFFRNATDWYKWFNVSILASVIMSIYGALQLAGKIKINQGGVRLDGTFGNASYFAIYLVFHIFLSLYLLYKNYQNKFLRWVYIVIVLGESWILYFTATRGAILGFIGGIVLASMLVAWKERENLFVRKIAKWILLVVVVFVIAFFSLRNVSFIKDSPVLSRFASMSISEAKNQGRYYVWPMAIKGAMERPILGWGQENFNFVFNKNYDPRMYAQEQWFDRTHNVILDWLIAGGILGLISYLSIYAFLFLYVWKRENNMSVVEKSLLTGMIFAYIFHNMFVFDNLVSYIMFFSILAYVETRVISSKIYESKFYTKEFGDKILKGVVLPGVSIVVILAIYFINVPAISTNTTLIKSLATQDAGGVEKNLEMFKKAFAYNSFGSSEVLEQFAQVSSQVVNSNQVPETLKTQFYDLTKQKLEEKLKKTPNDARYVVFASSFFNRVGKYDEAIKYAEKAVELSPKKQSMYFELGTSYIGKKDFTKALEKFKKAYDLAPGFNESKIIYAIGGIYAKDSNVVNEMLKIIDAETFLADNRFLRAYADTGNMNAVILILNERLKRDPENAQYKLSLASTYLQIGEKQKAISLINEIIAKDPSFKEQGESYINYIKSL